MKPPNGFAVKAYLTLIKLYADQENVHITGTFEVDGVSAEFDSKDPIPSYEEIVKRYGKTKKEIEQGLE